MRLHTGPSAWLGVALAAPVAAPTDEGLAATVFEATGASVDGSCTERGPGPFERVVLVGTFVFDEGCVSMGYLVDGVYVPSREESAPALVSAGWGDPERRAELALAWTHELEAYPIERGHVRVRGDGEVVVRGTRSAPPGMTPGTARVRVRAEYSPSAELASLRIDGRERRERE